jgi:hypothetical protein
MIKVVTRSRQQGASAHADRHHVQTQAAIGGAQQQHPSLQLTAPPEKSVSTARLRTGWKAKTPLGTICHGQAPLNLPKHLI